MNCPICNDNVSEEPRTTTAFTFKCPNCGPLTVSDEVILTHALDSIKLRSSIFYYLRVIKQNHLKSLYHTTILQILTTGIKIGDISTPLKDFDKYYPKSFDKKIDMIMQLLHTEISNFNNCFSYCAKNEIVSSPQKYFFLPCDENEINTMKNKNVIDILEKMNYVAIDSPNRYNPVQANFELTFTVNGWEKIDSLIRTTKSNTVFIAMSFNQTQSHITEAEEAIKEAIKEANYMPMIIKDKEHNQSITQEIDYEIKRANFIIADLTSQCNGAYYEAGLAKGYGKEVIFTCHEDDFNNRHFDVNQINTIKWSNKENLSKQLYNRIHYTIGDYSSI